MTNARHLSFGTRAARAARKVTIAIALGSLLATVPFVVTRPALGAPSSHPASVDLSDYEGHWLRIEDDEAHEARISAIGHALERLSWIMRRFASPILKKTTTPPAEMSFVWDGQRLYQGVEGKNGRFSRAIDLDGELLVAKDNRGVDFSSAWTWTDSGLRLRWEQHQATGNNLYRINTQDQTLVVEHTILVTAISNVRPIVFLSRFSRTDREQVADSGAIQDERAFNEHADRP